MDDNFDQPEQVLEMAKIQINVRSDVMGYFRESEITSLLKCMTMLIDTREQKNEHITDYFKSKNLPMISKKLNYGDYSFIIPTNLSGGLLSADMNFDNKIVIERKSGLDELSANFTSDRERFEREFVRNKEATMVLMIESASFDDICDSNYRSKLNSKSFIGSLLTFQHRYNINVNFINKENAGLYIHMCLYYFLRDYLYKI